MTRLSIMRPPTLTAMGLEVVRERYRAACGLLLAQRAQFFAALGDELVFVVRDGVGSVAWRGGGGGLVHGGRGPKAPARIMRRCLGRM
jgi:hypothetical protein